MVFSRLAKHHDRGAFDCGVEGVNRYFQQSARQQADRELALTFVLTETQADAEVIGYYTLLMATVSCDIVPRKGLPKGGTAPAVLLAQLGVDRRHQGRGHGRRLLYHALYQSTLAAEHVGCCAVVLDATDEKAAAFYRERGFQALLDHPQHLWLPMSAVRAMFEEIDEGRP